MSTIGQNERATQNRVIALFCEQLADRYLGNWTDRSGNSNIAETILSDGFASRGQIKPGMRQELLTGRICLV